MNEESTNPTPPADPMAAINARLDAQDKTNEAIIAALAKLTSSPASESAAGSFRAPAPKAPIVVEKTPEDTFLDKIVDRLQARLGLAATGVATPQAEPGGPCNLCDGSGVNAGGVIGCNRCMGTGIMPGRRLS